MNAPKTLTPQQVSFFHEEGYLIVPDVFDPADLEPLRKALHAELNRKLKEMQAEGKVSDLHDDLDFDRQLAAVQQDSKENGETLMRHLEGLRGGGYHAPEMFDVIAHEKMISAVSSLLGTEEVVSSSVYRIRPKLPSIGRGVIPWHQDSGYFSEHCDKQMIITCWTPLVDATVENGCMQILPRTHQGEIVKHYTGGNAGLLVIKDEDLPDDPRKSIAAVCPRGGVVFMTNRTPHCSTPNYSDHIRWSLDLRYQSADAPSNVGMWPETIDETGKADDAFYEKINVACYPPEADFLVSSKEHPEDVTDYAEYVKRRETYDKTLASFTAYGRWPESITADK